MFFKKKRPAEESFEPARNGYQNYTSEQIEQARDYYRRQAEALRPIATPQDIIDYDNARQTKGDQQ